MNALLIALLPIVGALLGYAVGYYVRRNESLRDRRLDAAEEVLATFQEAAVSGADLLSVQFQTGYPWKLNRETWTAEQVAEMTAAHSSAWTDADEKRHRFLLAQQSLTLVADDETRRDSAKLADFLHRAIYSGGPWTRKDDYPDAGLNPVDIAPEGRKVSERFANQTARRSWGRSISVDDAQDESV